MTELVKGDIFCHEMKLKGRKAFLVDNIVEDTAICIDRDAQLQINKKISGTVVLLRHVNE